MDSLGYGLATALGVHHLKLAAQRTHMITWIFRIALAVFLLLAAGAMLLTVVGVDVGLLRERD